MKVLELLGIVLLRFRPLPRMWAVLLMLVNAGSLLFLDTIYGQMTVASVLAAVAVMTVIYSRTGFVRLLGVGHVFWLLLLPWLVANLSEMSAEPNLYRWAITLLILNSISLVIDTIDVVRFIRGEREPHYRWSLDTNG